MDVRRATTAGLLCLALGIAIPASAQVETEPPPAVPGAQPVTVERIRIRGAALEGNLEGNAVEREVLVILPPSYAREPERRYPVVYALHGYSIGAEQWAKEIHVPQSIEGAFGKGAREMIVVMPDSKTLHNGSMYSASITTGNFEAFIARDVVSYIDAHYRTISRRESRGLVGHSMGGYGASRIGMKHADVFGSLYIMSPCCLSPRAAGPADKLQALVDEAKTTEDLANLPFGLRTTLAVASAWSPNPKKPPLYADLPVGDLRDNVLARWAANAPLAFVDQYIQELKRYRGIAIDVGDQDGLKTDTARLHEILDTWGVEHTFEIYPGTHTSHVAIRFQEHVLPFFSRTLE